jgi:hypothetical protein
VKSLAAQVTQSRLTFIIGGHRLAARRYNICVADGGIGGGVGGRIFLFTGHLSPGSRLVDGHVDAVHNQLYKIRKCLILIRIKLFSSMLGSQTIADPCGAQPTRQSMGKITKLFKTVVWNRIIFNADPVQAF